MFPGVESACTVRSLVMLGACCEGLARLMSAIWLIAAVRYPALPWSTMALHAFHMVACAFVVLPGLSAPKDRTPASYLKSGTSLDRDDTGDGSQRIVFDTTMISETQHRPRDEVNTDVLDREEEISGALMDVEVLCRDDSGHSSEDRRVVDPRVIPNQTIQNYAMSRGSLGSGGLSRDDSGHSSGDRRVDNSRASSNSTILHSDMVVLQGGTTSPSVPSGRSAPGGWQGAHASGSQRIDWMTSARAQLQEFRRRGLGSRLMWLCVLRRVVFREDSGYRLWFRATFRDLHGEFREDLDEQVHNAPATAEEVQWAARVEHAAFQDYMEYTTDLVPTCWGPLAHLPNDDWYPQPVVAIHADPAYPFGIFHAAWVDTQSGTWGPAGTEPPTGAPVVQAAEGPTRDTEPEVTDETAMLKLGYAVIGAAARSVGAFEEAWEEGHVPAWYQDLVDRLEFLVDRGADTAEVLRVLTRVVAEKNDERFVLDNEPILNRLQRAVHEYVPDMNDPVLARMGLVDADEIEETVCWVVAKLRHWWFWGLCPVAMTNRRMEDAMHTLGYGPRSVGEPYVEEDRERRGLSRSRTPQRSRPAGSRSGLVPPVVSLPEEESDAVCLFQAPGRLDWQDLMERFHRWFEEGRAVGLAVQMVRHLARIRGEQKYLEWVQAPIHTIAAGVPNSDGEDSSTTPPCFRAWAESLEHLLHSGFARDQDLRITIPVPRVTNTGGDAVSLMDNRGRGARDRDRDSRSPRRTPRPTSCARSTGRREGAASSSGAYHQYRGTGRRERSEWVDVVVDQGSERASGSNDRAPIRRDSIRVPRESRLPDVTQPMDLNQAVLLWKYVLFDRQAFNPPRPAEGRIPNSFLPLETLREVSTFHESMTPANRAISTVALVSMLRYLMAELAQLMDVADAIARSREGTANPVDLEEDDDETHMMQTTFFRTGGLDSDGQRWARAMIRLQKELSGCGDSVRRQVIDRLRAGLPTMGSNQVPTIWREQLLALLLVMGEYCAPTDGHTPVVTDEAWYRSWAQELSVFIPGFGVATGEVVEDSMEGSQVDLAQVEADHDFAKLLQDEEDEKQWKQKEDDFVQEEQQKYEAQEVQFLQAEAAAYQSWEDAQMRAQLSREADGRNKRRCTLSLRASLLHSRTGHRRTLHTLEMEVPGHEEELQLSLTALVDDSPSNVSTVLVDGGAMGDGKQTASQQADGMSQQAEGISLSFREYEQLYAQWERGQITLREITDKYGKDTAELLQAQKAVMVNEDRQPVVSGNAEPVSVATVAMASASTGEVIPGLGAIGRPRLRFGFFESIYGQWKDRRRSDAEVESAYGPVWVALFHLWQRWGLKGVWVYLPEVLDMEPDPSPSGP